MYPPGAQLSRPLHLFTQRPHFFLQNLRYDPDQSIFKLPQKINLCFLRISSFQKKKFMLVYLLQVGGGGPWPPTCQTFMSKTNSSWWCVVLRKYCSGLSPDLYYLRFVHFGTFWHVDCSVNAPGWRPVCDKHTYNSFRWATLKLMWFVHRFFFVIVPKLHRCMENPIW